MGKPKEGTSVKTFAKPLGLLALSLLSLVLASGQTKVKPVQKRTVSLDTVLACLHDSLLEDVFKTGKPTMDSLDSFAMTIMNSDPKKKDDLDFLGLKAKMFYTRPAAESEFSILPTEILENGKIRIMGDSKLTFCHYDLVAHYQSRDDLHALPTFIKIDGQDWLLNPNEVFVHADQFKFQSGVFEDSSDVYLMASKARVDIQFLCKPDGLKFYRVFYFHPERNSSYLGPRGDLGRGT